MSLSSPDLACDEIISMQDHLNLIPIKQADPIVCDRVGDKEMPNIRLPSLQKLHHHGEHWYMEPGLGHRM